MENEIWKDIAGYEGLYQVSNLGRVKSLYRFIYLKFKKDKWGYPCVNLCKKKKTRFFIHRLVAVAFIPNPGNKPEVNHKDGVKIRNFDTNLEWSTPLENTTHAIITGLRKYTKTALIYQYDINGTFIKSFNSIYEASKETGINDGNIWRCANNEIKHVDKFIWRYS